MADAVEGGRQASLPVLADGLPACRFQNSRQRCLRAETGWKPVFRANGFLTLMRQTSLNESLEERVGLVRFALEFWVILTGEKIGVIAQLD